MKKFVSIFLALALILSLSAVPTFAAETEFILTNLGIPMQTYISNSQTAERLFARSVWDIEEFGGRIYIGGGNYAINMNEAISGGVPLLSYTEQNGWSKEASFYEHQMARLIKANGKLYIPANNRAGYIYSYDGKTDWQQVNGFSAAVHTFDVLVKDNVIYAGYGFQQNGPGRVFASSDGGATYNPIYMKYNGSNVTPSGSEFARVYNLFEFGGNVYATLRITNATSTTYDGFYKLDKANNVFTYFSKGHIGLIANDITGAFDATIGNTFAFCSSNTSNKLIYTSDLTTFKTATLPNNGAVTCVKAINNEFYVTAYTKSGSVYKTNLYKSTDLTNFELVYSLEYSTFIRSFCYSNGVFYFGTSGNRTSPESTIGTVFKLAPKPGFNGDEGKDDVTTTLPELGLFSGEYSAAVGGVVYEVGAVEDGETYAVNFTYAGENGEFGFFTADKDGIGVYTNRGDVDGGKTIITANGSGTYTAYVTVDKLSEQGDTLYIYKKGATANQTNNVTNITLTPLANAITNEGVSILKGKTSAQAIRYYFGYNTTDGKDIILGGNSYEVVERGFLLANGAGRIDDGVCIDSADVLKKSVSGEALTNCWQVTDIGGGKSNIWFSSYVDGFANGDTRKLFVKGYITFKANGNEFTIYADASNGSVATIDALQ